MIQPWLVNRYQDQPAVDRWMKNVMTQDLARINELHTTGRAVGYLPLIFPGFSWYNLNGAYNVAPRNGGQFYWYQAYKILSLGVDNIMIANFDEVDEGTAIYKCVVNEAQVPDPAQFSELKQFLHYNSGEPTGSNYPSDWYLRVTREIRKLMMGTTPLIPNLPIAPGAGVVLTDTPEPPLDAGNKLTRNGSGKSVFYPNPTSGWVYIDLPTAEPGELRVQNTFSQVVLNKTLTSDGLVNISTLLPGMYIVTLQQGAMITTDQLIIK
jgi:hypothetical protein